MKAATQMKYEVFISYSRKDTKVADRVCKAFDKAGITYFIDREGISGGYEFPVVLAEAIIECRLVLFLGSKNAYESKYTNSELTFAFNEKPKNSILPYVIDGSTMPPALRFVFSSINWRTIESHPIETTLVSDVLNLLGRKPHEVSEEQTASKKRVVPKEPKVDEVKTSNKRVEKEVASQKSPKSVTPLPKNEPSKPRFDWLKSNWKYIAVTLSLILFVIVGSVSVVNTLQERKAEKVAKELAQKAAREKAEQERIAKMVAEGKGRDGVYRIGDYYNRDGKEGVVFEVSSDGRHGKIVSLTVLKEELQWLSNEEEQERLIGANDEYDGANNMAKVRAIEGWREKYPAFAWCANLGGGWYLPAKEELLAIFRNKETIYKTLFAKNEDDLIEFYHWSSTEHSKFCAWGVGMYDGSTNGNGKNASYYVRAVSAF